MSKNLGKYVYNESELLGQGAFGKVYRGINTSTREEVAIKVQNLRNVKPHILEAIKNEENTKCLLHPHLVKLHDVFDFEDKKIFVMELCKGDLSKTLKTRQLCETDVHKILQQLIAGFKELVRLGLLHRDIKPANCFENNGIYKLGDFGAIVEADYTNKKLMKLQYGTMAYESPQMLNREKYSTKCDVWSLGILCFEMLYNEKPWICVSEGQYLRAMKQWPVRFPLTKKVSDQCKDFISKCLEYQEKQRMSWDEVFQHPWLHSNERTYSEIGSFETEIMKQLRLTSQLGSFDPSETFKNYDIDNRGALDLRKFELFLAHFDPRITKKEISNLFSYLSKDNLLNRQGFQNIFINNKDYLGKGSFGKVYKGKDPNNDQEVAIKIMDMTNFHDNYMISQLKNEIQVMKELKDDHIVELLDVFGDKKQTVMILELCDGDLRHYIKQRGGRLPENEALDILQQLMKGFQKMIMHNYIHRDIKPENSLYKGFCHKVADFGFATRVDGNVLRESVGTPLYMAPQLLQKLQYSNKCDIWSIGIVAYEMVYGKQPWSCRDRNSYLMNIKNQPLKFPIDVRVSDEYQDLIRECLKLEEVDRISWEGLFKHKLLNQQERNYKKMDVKIDKEGQLILAKIQKIVQARGLDVSEQFKKFDKDKGGSLDFQEFFQFLIQLDQGLTGKEIKQLFYKIDLNGDQNIGLDEFRRIFCEYDYVNEDAADRIIVDLKEIIKANKLELEQIFSNFDADQEGDLDIDEFTQLIKAIAKDIKDYDIKAIFHKFDIDNDHKINFEEFQNQLDYKKDYQQDHDSRLKIKDNLIQVLNALISNLLMNYAHLQWIMIQMQSQFLKILPNA